MLVHAAVVTSLGQNEVIMGNGNAKKEWSEDNDRHDGDDRNITDENGVFVKRCAIFKRCDDEGKHESGENGRGERCVIDLETCDSEDDPRGSCSELNKDDSARNQQQGTGGRKSSLKDSPRQLSPLIGIARMESEDGHFPVENEVNDVFLDRVKKSLEQINAGGMVDDDSSTENSATAAIGGNDDGLEKCLSIISGMVDGDSSTENSATAAIGGNEDGLEKCLTIISGMGTKYGMVDGKSLERECDRECLTVGDSPSIVQLSQETGGALEPERAYITSYGVRRAEKCKENERDTLTGLRESADFGSLGKVGNEKMAPLVRETNENSISGNKSEDAIAGNTTKAIHRKNPNDGIALKSCNEDTVGKSTREDLSMKNAHGSIIDRDPDRSNSDRDTDGAIVGRGMSGNSDRDIISRTASESISDKNAHKSVKHSVRRNTSAKTASAEKANEDRVANEEAFVGNADAGKDADEDFVGKDCNTCAIFRNADEDSSDRSIGEDITDSDLSELTNKLRKSIERMLSEESSEDCEFVTNDKEARTQHREYGNSSSSSNHENEAMSMAGSDFGKGIYTHREDNSTNETSDGVNVDSNDFGMAVCSLREDNSINYESEALCITDSDCRRIAPNFSIACSNEFPMEITNVCSNSEGLFDESRGTKTIEISSDGVVNTRDKLDVISSTTQMNREGNETAQENVDLEDSTTDIQGTPNIQLENEKQHDIPTREDCCTATSDMESKEAEHDGRNDFSPKASPLIDGCPVDESHPSKCNHGSDNCCITEAPHTAKSTVSCASLEVPPGNSAVDIAIDVQSLSASKVTTKLIDTASNTALSGRALVEHTEKTMDQIFKSGLTDALLSQQGPSSQLDEKADGDVANTGSVRNTDSQMESPFTRPLPTSKSTVMSLSGSSISRDPAFKFITTLLEKNNAKVVSSSLDSTVLVISANAGEDQEKAGKEGEMTEKGRTPKELKKQPKATGNDLAVIGKKPISQEKASLLLEKESVPHGDEPLPHGDASVPHGDESVPHGDESVPHGDESVPHGDESVPHGDESAPHGDEPLPHGDASVPHGDESVPLESASISLQNKSISLGKEHVLQGNASISLKNELAPLETKSVLQGDGSVSLERESILLENNSISLEKEQVRLENISISLQNESMQLQIEAISLEKDPVSQENVSTLLQSESILLENESISLEKEQVSKDNLSTSLQNDSASLETESISQRFDSVSAESKSISLKDKSLEKEQVSQEIASTPLQNETIPLEKGSISHGQELVSQNNASLSMHSESIPAEGTSVSAEKGSISQGNLSISLENESMPLEGTSISLDEETLTQKEVLIRPQNESIASESEPVSPGREPTPEKSALITVKSKAMPLEAKSVPQTNAPMSSESEPMPIKSKPIQVNQAGCTKGVVKETVMQDRPLSANRQSSKSAQSVAKAAQDFSTLLVAEQIYNSFIPIAKLPTLENFDNFGNISINLKSSPYIGKQKANDRRRNSGRKSSNKRKRDDKRCENMANKQLGTNIVCSSDNNLTINYVLHPKSKSEVSIVSKNEGLLVKNSTKRETHRNNDVKRIKTLESVDEAKIDWLEKQFLSENLSSQERIKRYCNALKRTLVAKKNPSDPTTEKKDADGNIVQSLKTLSVKNLASIRPSETMGEVCSSKDVAKVLESLAPDVQDVVQCGNDSGKASPKVDGIVNVTITSSENAEKTKRVVSQVYRTQSLPRQPVTISSGYKMSGTVPKKVLKTQAKASATVTTKACVPGISQQRNAPSGMSILEVDSSSKITRNTDTAEKMLLDHEAKGDGAGNIVAKLQPPVLLKCLKTSLTCTKSTGVATPVNLVILGGHPNTLQKGGNSYIVNVASSKVKKKERLVGASKRKPDKRDDVLKPCDVYGSVSQPLSTGLACLPRQTSVLATRPSNWPVLNHNGAILVPVQNYPTLDNRLAYANVIGSATLPAKFVRETASAKDETKRTAVGNTACNSINVNRPKITSQDGKVVMNTNECTDVSGTSTGTVCGVEYPKQNRNNSYGVPTIRNYPLKYKSASSISRNKDHPRMNSFGKVILTQARTRPGQASGSIEHKQIDSSNKTPKKRGQPNNLAKGLKGDQSFQILKSVPETTSESIVIGQHNNENNILLHHSTTGQTKEVLQQPRSNYGPLSQGKSGDNLAMVNKFRNDILATNKQVKLKVKANQESSKERNTDDAALTKTNHLKEALPLNQGFKETNSGVKSNPDSLARQIAKHLFGNEKKPLLQSVFSGAKMEINGGTLGKSPRPSGVDVKGDLESSSLKFTSNVETGALLKETSSDGGKSLAGRADKSTHSSVIPEVRRSDTKMQEVAGVYNPKISAYLSPEELAKNNIDNTIFRVRKVSLGNDSSDNRGDSAKNSPAVFVLENPADVSSSRLCIRVPSSVNRKEAACLVKDLKEYISQQAVKELVKPNIVQGEKAQNMEPAPQDSSAVCFKALVEYLRKPNVKTALEKIIKQNRKKATISEVKECEAATNSGNSTEPNVAVSGNDSSKLFVSSGISVNSETVGLAENTQATNQSSSSTANDILELEDVERALQCFESRSETPILQGNETDNVSVGEIEKLPKEVNHVVTDRKLAVGTKPSQTELNEADNVGEGGSVFKDLDPGDLSKVSEGESRERKRKLFDDKRNNDSNDFVPYKRKLIRRKVTLRNVASTTGHVPNEDIISSKDDKPSHYLEAAVRSIVNKNLHLVSSASLVTKPAASRPLLRARRATVRKTSYGVSSDKQVTAMMNQNRATCLKTSEQPTKPSPVSCLLWRNIRYNANLIGRKRTLIEPASTMFSWECMHMFSGRTLRHDRTAIIDKLQKCEVKMQRIRECYRYTQKRTYSREEMNRKVLYDCIVTGKVEKSPSSLRATASKCPVFSVSRDSSLEKRSAGDILNEKAKLLSHSFFSKRRSKLKWKDQKTSNKNGELAVKSWRAGDKRGASAVKQYTEDSEPYAAQRSGSTKNCTCSKVVNNIGGAVFESSIGSLAKSITKHVKKRRISNGDVKTCPKCKKVLQNAKELTRHMLYHLVDKAVDQSFQKDGAQGGMKRSSMKDLIANTRKESKPHGDNVECFDVTNGSNNECFEPLKKFPSKETQIYKAQFWARHQIPCTPSGAEDLEANDSQVEGVSPKQSRTVWTPLYFDVPVKPVKWKCLNCKKKYHSIKELKLHADECARNGPGGSSRSDSETDVDHWT